MGRMYSISFTEVAVSAIQDLFEILVPSDAVMVLHSFILAQSSDAGDAQAEVLALLIRRVTGSPTSGSGGSSPTPQPLEQGDAAAGITAEVNNTTQISGGTAVNLLADGWNVQIPYQWLPTPEMRFVFSPSTRCVISLETAPNDALTVSGTAIVEEIGG